MCDIRVRVCVWVLYRNSRASHSLYAGKIMGILLLARLLYFSPFRIHGLVTTLWEDKWGGDGEYWKLVWYLKGKGAVEGTPSLV